MTIRNLDQYVSRLWDWKILDGCFGSTKIRVSDIDGYVERNGFILLIEAKGNGVPVPYGQRIAFDAFVKTKIITVMIVWGDPGVPTEIQVWPFKKKPSDLSGFRDLVSRWYKAADTRTFKERKK